MAKRANPEAKIHREVVRHLRTRGVANMAWWHTPNQGKRRTGAQLTVLGMLAGVSDIVAVHRGKFYALELKAPGGRASEDQLAFQANIAKAGGYGCIAEGQDAAIRSLEAWGLLKGCMA